jgi:C-terminal processing protease CtpA/Prc
VFRPDKNNHFDGNIYLLQGGYTFSAATMFIANLKGEKNVTVLGEETGGGSYGNSSVHLPTIKLPHSGLKIILPMYRIVLNRNNTKTGRGIVPDIPVYPSSAAIRRGADVKMEQVQALISAGNRQESHTGSTLQ